MKKIIRMFREIQIICFLYNDIHQYHIIPATVLLTTIITPVCIFVFTWGSGNLNFITFLFFSNILVVGICSIFLCSHFPALLYSLSKRLLVSNSRLLFYSKVDETFKNIRIVKKYWRSFPLFKVCFSSCNYFESGTPLIILNFSMHLAINLILLGK